MRQTQVSTGGAGSGGGGGGLESGDHLSVHGELGWPLHGEADVFGSAVAVTGAQLAGQRRCSRSLRALRSSTSWYVTRQLSRLPCSSRPI